MITEQEKEEGSTSSAINVDDSKEDINLGPTVQEVLHKPTIQEKNIQFWSKHTSKGKL